MGYFFSLLACILKRTFNKYIYSKGMTPKIKITSTLFDQWEREWGWVLSSSQKSLETAACLPC